MRAWVVLGVGLGVLFPLQARLDGSKAEEPPIVETLLPAEILPALAVGQGGAAADLLEIQALNFLLERLQHVRRLDPKHLEVLYRGIVALDPQDPDAYERGSVLLSSLASRPEQGAALLADGIERVDPRHPRRWRLFLELAGTHIISLASAEPERREHHVRQAGEILMRVRGLKGAPEGLTEIGRRLATRGLSRLEALQHERQTWVGRTQSGPQALRREARQRVSILDSALEAVALDAAARRFALKGGRPALRLDDLKPPQDPAKVGFVLLPGGDVQSVAYQVSRLEGPLLAAHEQSVQAGEPFVLDPEVPPYVQVEETDEGVVVEARALTPALQQASRVWAAQRAWERTGSREDLAWWRREQLQAAWDRAVEAGEASSLEALDVAPEVLEDPFGVGFLVEDGLVCAPGLFAWELERLLSGWRSEDATWREAAVGEVIPPHSLGFRGFPSYLELVRGEDQLRVRAR